MKRKFASYLLLVVPLVLVMLGGCTKANNVFGVNDAPNLPRQSEVDSEKPGSFEKLLPIGAQAPDFDLETLDGTKVSLQSLRGKVVVLVTGARTGSAFLVWANSMDELYKAYQERDDVEFFILYTREPYAGTMPGYGWGFRDIKQPKTYDERKQYASTCREEYRIDIPC